MTWLACLLASTLLAIASILVAMASNLIASSLLAETSHEKAEKSPHLMIISSEEPSRQIRLLLEKMIRLSKLFHL